MREHKVSFLMVTPSEDWSESLLSAFSSVGVHAVVVNSLPEMMNQLSKKPFHALGFDAEGLEPAVAHAAQHVLSVLKDKISVFLFSSLPYMPHYLELTKSQNVHIITKPLSTESMPLAVLSRLGSGNAMIGDYEALGSVLQKSLQDLLSAYLGNGFEVGQVTTNPKHELRGVFGSIVSLEGNQSCGALLCSMDEVFLNKIIHAMVGNQKINRDVARDAIGELCNQLAGIIQNLFAQHKIGIDIGVPRCFDVYKDAKYFPATLPSLVVPVRFKGTGLAEKIAFLQKWDAYFELSFFRLQT